ncbi:MAG: hypothetical protein ACRDRW_04210 [Pseudonocardiaceae bacterium]
MSRYGHIWLEIAQQQYDDLTAHVRELVDCAIEQLLEDPTGRRDAVSRLTRTPRPSSFSARWPRCWAVVVPSHASTCPSGGSSDHKTPQAWHKQFVLRTVRGARVVQT